MFYLTSAPLFIMQMLLYNLFFVFVSQAPLEHLLLLWIHALQISYILLLVVVVVNAQSLFLSLPNFPFKLLFKVFLLKGSYECFTVICVRILLNFILGEIYCN